jgi:hypothetical protein
VRSTGEFRHFVSPTTNNRNCFTISTQPTKRITKQIPQKTLTLFSKKVSVFFILKNKVKMYIRKNNQKLINIEFIKT